MASVDVSIRGAGVFGLSIAWACLQAGARVEVVDPNGVAAGASGGIVGALAPHVPENWNAKKAFQLDSLLRAEPFWAGVEAVGGIP
ncbi:MAG: FAD-dependent oxidoreductase, partial [Pseudomonadota bacterium]